MNLPALEAKPQLPTHYEFPPMLDPSPASNIVIDENDDPDVLLQKVKDFINNRERHLKSQGDAIPSSMDRNETQDFCVGGAFLMVQQGLRDASHSLRFPDTATLEKGLRRANPNLGGGAFVYAMQIVHYNDSRRFDESFSGLKGALMHGR